MDTSPKPWFQGFYSFMDTLNCPNQYKIPGGRAFDELFDAWTLDTTIVDRCFCQIIRKIYNYWGCQSSYKYIIICDRIFGFCLILLATAVLGPQLASNWALIGPRWFILVATLRALWTLRPLWYPVSPHAASHRSMRLAVVRLSMASLVRLSTASLVRLYMASPAC